MTFCNRSAIYCSLLDADDAQYVATIVGLETMRDAVALMIPRIIIWIASPMDMLIAAVGACDQL